MKYEHVSLPKPQSQLAQLYDDDEDDFETSLIGRYVARPVSLQNMCLATRGTLDCKPDKLAQNVPSQSEAQEARQAIPGAHK